MANKTSMPVKDRKKRNQIYTYLQKKNTRDYVMARVQFNTALRISDVLPLKVCDFLNVSNSPEQKWIIKDHLEVIEQKTKKARKIRINEPLGTTVMYYAINYNLKHDDYLFSSQKNRAKPITTTQAHRIFQDVGIALNIPNFSSHSLRKTWGYECYMKTKNIALLMSIYGHTSESITLRYIGIEQQDKDEMFNRIRI